MPQYPCCRLHSVVANSRFVIPLCRRHLRIITHFANDGKNPMNEYYEFSFDELRLEISQYSPSAARILEQIKASCGAQTAYYAAFVIVCLKAQQDLPTSKSLHTLTSADLKDFTFFEVARDDQRAINLFDEVLHSYRTEQRVR